MPPLDDSFCSEPQLLSTSARASLIGNSSRREQDSRGRDCPRPRLVPAPVPCLNLTPWHVFDDQAEEARVAAAAAAATAAAADSPSPDETERQKAGVDDSGEGDSGDEDDAMPDIELLTDPDD